MALIQLEINPKVLNRAAVILADIFGDRLKCGTQNICDPDGLLVHYIRIE